MRGRRNPIHPIGRTWWGGICSFTAKPWWGALIGKTTYGAALCSCAAILDCIGSVYLVLWSWEEDFWVGKVCVTVALAGKEGRGREGERAEGPFFKITITPYPTSADDYFRKAAITINHDISAKSRYGLKGFRCGL